MSHNDLLVKFSGKVINHLMRSITYILLYILLVLEFCVCMLLDLRATNLLISSHLS